MMAAARDSAEEQQRDRFFGALEIIRDDARRAGVQACVVLSNEHFTNFFLENFPQICVGVGERNWGPTEAWLPISKAWIPGHPGLAGHITRSLLNTGFDPAFSHQLELDHGVMTVYHELDPQLQLPLVPIVQNCAVHPMMPLRRWYAFGVALGEAIRSYVGLDRVALVGAGGLSHFIGVPRVGDIDEEFDRWFLDVLERGDMDAVLDLPDEELELAGNGAHEIRSWLAVAGAVAPARGQTLSLRADLPVDHGHGRLPLPARLLTPMTNPGCVAGAGSCPAGLRSPLLLSRRRAVLEFARVADCADAGTGEALKAIAGR